MTRFVTTRWSLVLALGQSTADVAHTALSELCEIYWRPVYAFIRRSGRSPDDAADLTQSFFALVVEKRYFEQARRDRGRFRSFLLTAVRHFLSHDYHAAHALKRGGAHIVLRLDDADQAETAQMAAEHQSPEDAFEQRWAESVVAAARQRLRDRHAAGWMKGRLFGPLADHLFSEGDESYAVLAVRLQSSEGSLRVMAHRLREGYAHCLRDVVADTVASPEDVDRELQYLRQLLGRAGH